MSPGRKTVRAGQALRRALGVLAYRPSVVVYPTLTVLGIAVALAGFVYALLGLLSSRGDGGIPLEYGMMIVGLYFVMTVLWVFLSGATFYEVRAVYRGETPRIFAGLRAVWERRRQLLALALVLTGVGLIRGYLAGPIRRVLGGSARAAFELAATEGAVFTVQAVMFSTGSLEANARTAKERLDSVLAESIMTTEVVQGISSLGITLTGVAGMVSFLAGVRVEPFGQLTSVVVFLLGPPLTVLVAMTIDWIARPALYLYAVEDELPTAGANPERMVRSEDGPHGTATAR